MGIFLILAVAGVIGSAVFLTHRDQKKQVLDDELEPEWKIKKISNKQRSKKKRKKRNKKIQESSL